MKKRTRSYSIQEAAKLLKVSTKTLRRWEQAGIIVPIRTVGGHRRYTGNEIQTLKLKPKRKEPKIVSDVDVNPFIHDVPVSEQFISLPKHEDFKLSSDIKTNRSRIYRTASLFLLFAGILVGLNGLGKKINEIKSSALSLNTDLAEKTYNDPRVLADSASLTNLSLNMNIPANFREQVNINQNVLVSGEATISGNLRLQNGVINADSPTLNLNAATTVTSGNLNIGGNTLTSPGDLTINPTGGGTKIGTGTQKSVDMAGGDLFVSGDTETAGTTYANTLAINGDAFTDLTGTGLEISGGALTTTLGTSITTGEIDDDTIKEVDLNISNDPTNGYALTYNSSTGGFTWTDLTTAISGTGWTDDGTVVRLNTSTDDVSIGSATDLAKLGVVGDSDETQLLVRGNSTQTNNLLSLQNSAASSVFSVANSGNITTSGSLTLNSDTISDFTGNGLQVSGGSLTIKLPNATDALSSTTSNGSGLEVLSSGLALLQGCADTEILKWNESNDSWECATDSGGSGSAGVVNVQNDDVAVGTSVDTIDFDTFFTVTASPTNEANVVIKADSLDFTEFKDAMTLDANTSIALGSNTLSTSGTGALSFASTGQVTLAGNVDATNGVDVTGASLTVGGNATITTAGAETLADDLAVNGADITTTGTTATVFNTNATTLSIGGAATTALNLGTGNTAYTAINLGTGTGGNTINIGTDNTTADTLNLGSLKDTLAIKGTSITTTLLTTNSALFSSSTANSDSIAIKPQSGTATNSFTGTLTSADLTAARTFTLPDATGTLCLDTGNCAGTGTGVTQSGSNANAQVAYFTSSNNITSDSSFVYNTGATTGNTVALSNASLTTGKLFSGSATNTATTNTAISQFLLDLTNAQSTAANTNGFAGFAVNFTNNPSVAGNTEYAARVQNQSTSNTTDNAVAALLLLDNADTSGTGSTVVTDAIRITNSGGISSGVTNGITFGSTTIATGLNFSSTPTTNYISGTNLTITAAGAETLADDLAVNGADITTSGSTATIFNTNATTLSLGGAATTALNLGTGNSAYTAINLGTGTAGNTINVGTDNTTADTINIGSLKDTLAIKGTSITTTLLTTNSALFSSSTTNADSIAIKPQSGTATNSFTGTITSADLTGSDTWTFPDATGTICLSTGNCAGAGTGITGSGTATQLAFFSGGTQNITSDSSLYWDNTSKLLGIGTSSPVGKLHVTGAVTGKALAIFNETGDQNILVASASGTTVATINRSGQLTLNTTTANADQIALVGNSTGASTFVGSITEADISADRSWTFPDAAGTVCLTSGNCAGVGGNGDVSGSGTSGQIAFFTGTKTISSESSGFGWDTSNKLFTVVSTTATGTGAALSDTSLTTGKLFSLTGTSTPVANTATTQDLLDVTYAQGTAANTNGFVGLGVNFTNNPSVAGNTEFAARIQNQSTSNTTDNAVAALLLLDNADTSGTGSTVVTDALRITNSGAIAAGITNGLAFRSTTVDTGINFVSTPTTNYISGTNFTVTAAGAETLADDLAVNGADITTSGSTATLFNTNAATLSIGGASTTALNIGTGNSAYTAINLGTGTGGNTINLGTDNTTADTVNIGSLKDTLAIKGTSITTTLLTTNSALFSSSTTNADSIAIKPQSTTATNSFTGTITSADLTAARTWTLPDATGTICVSGQSCSLTGTVTDSTPGSNHQIAVFTAADDITGNANFLFNASNVSGTTTSSSFVLTDAALTTGSNFYVSATSTPVTSSSTSNGATFDLTEAAGTNATTYTGVNLKFTDASTVAANTEYAMQIQNQASGSSPTDNTVASLLRLDNADTATGNLIAVTDGLLVTNSGAASAGIVNGVTVGSGTQSITNGFKVGSTGVTTDLLLQNGETIDNDTDGTIALTATTVSTSSDLSVTGDVTITGNDITFGNAETISNATNNVIALGGTANSTVLRIPIKASTGDSGLDTTGGNMYYNSTDNVFRCYQNGAWTNCIASASGITGSGTSGQIAYFNGASSITSESSGFAWDATNNRLGLGNDAPTTTLNITGATQSVIADIENTVANNDIALTGTFGGSGGYLPGIVWSTSDNNPTKTKTAIWTNVDGSGSDLFFGTSNGFSTGVNNTALVIDELGRIDIGDNAAVSPLTITYAMTNGNYVNIGQNGSHAQTGTLRGVNVDLTTGTTATNQSQIAFNTTLASVTNTISSGTKVYEGLNVSAAGTITQNGGGGTTQFNGIDITNADITQTAGTIAANGALITTGAITTGGTQTGVNVSAAGVGAGTLNGINISNITGGSGTENALKIGSGWDANLLFNDTTTQIQIANTGVFTFEDDAGNDLMTLTDNSNAGDMVLSGDLTVTGGDIIGAATTNIVNAATTVNIGSTAVTRTINLGTGTNADTINIGTGGTTSDVITIGASGLGASGGSNLNLPGGFIASGAVPGKALAIFNETGDQNILTASASGTTIFSVARDSVIVGAQADATGSFTNINASTTAGSFGAETAVDAAFSSAVYNGKLYVATKETNAANIYRFDGGTTWTKVNNASGKIVSGDAADIDQIVLRVMNGKLYAGTSTGTTTAAAYEYNGSTWTMINSARGTFSASGVQNVTDMIAFNGHLYVAISGNGANTLSILVWNGATTWQSPTGGSAGVPCSGDGTDADSGVFAEFEGNLILGVSTAANTGRICRFDGSVFNKINAAGTFAGDANIDDVTALTVYGGRLFIGVGETDLAAIYYVDAGSDTITATDIAWHSTTTRGRIDSTNDATDVDSVTTFAIYNGHLYAGTNTANLAAVYELTGANSTTANQQWTIVNSTRGTFGSQTNVDKVDTMIDLNGTLYVGTEESNAGSEYTWTKTTANSYALRFDSGSANYGSISFIGSTQTGNIANTGMFAFSHGVNLTGGAFDLSEDYPTHDSSLEAGEVISIDPYEEGFVTKSKSPYDNNAVGVYSTNPGLRLSSGGSIDGASSVPVALSGRVPVKIASDSAEIKPGDYLTSSATPGKATKATNPGPVIGKAIGFWNPDSGTDTVLAFINISWANPSDGYSTDTAVTLEDRVASLERQLGQNDATGSASLSNNIKADKLSVLGDAVLSDTVINGKLNVGTLTFDNVDQSINAIGTLKIQSLALGNIEFENGLVRIDTKGNVVTNTITAQKYKVAGASAGTATLSQGTSQIVITTNQVTANSLVFVTPKKALLTPLAVTDKKNGESFTVSVSNAVSDDLEFDWFIIDKTN